MELEPGDGGGGGGDMYHLSLTRTEKSTLPCGRPDGRVSFRL